MIDYPEMQCGCAHERHKFGNAMGLKGKAQQCAQMIPYKHHHDWGDDSDFTCEDCLEFCGDKK